MDMTPRMNAFDSRQTKERQRGQDTNRESMKQIFCAAIAYLVGSVLAWAACFGIGVFLGLIAPEEHSTSGNRGSHLPDGRPDVTMQHTVSDTAAETVHLLLPRPSQSRVM